MTGSAEIQPFDFKRLLVGADAPWWFLAEIAGRITVIYFILLVAMRLMGKRMAGQMSVSEMAVLVTLGAAVGVPMQAPDRGMLPAVIILGAAVLFQRGISLWSFNRRKVELITQGDACVLVQDGCLLLSNMKANVLSRERLFSTLRVSGIEHLGELRRVYLEASGDVSIFKRAKPEPGLSILPTFDTELRNGELTELGAFACFSCGLVVNQESAPKNACRCCGSTQWTPAVVQVESKAAQHE